MALSYSPVIQDDAGSGPGHSYFISPQEQAFLPLACDLLCSWMGRCPEGGGTVLSEEKSFG